MSNDPIGDALEITTSDGCDEVTPVSRDVEVVKNSREEKTDLKRDYEYTRGQLYSLIEKGQEAIDGIMEISQETGSARAYEVTGQIHNFTNHALNEL